MNLYKFLIVTFQKRVKIRLHDSTCLEKLASPQKHGCEKLIQAILTSFGSTNKRIKFKRVSDLMQILKSKNEISNL